MDIGTPSDLALRPSLAHVLMPLFVKFAAWVCKPNVVKRSVKHAWLSNDIAPDRRGPKSPRGRLEQY